VYYIVIFTFVHSHRNKRKFVPQVYESFVPCCVLFIILHHPVKLVTYGIREMCDLIKRKFFHVFTFQGFPDIGTFRHRGGWIGSHSIPSMIKIKCIVNSFIQRGTYSHRSIMPFVRSFLQTDKPRAILFRCDRKSFEDIFVIYVQVDVHVSSFQFSPTSGVSVNLYIILIPFRKNSRV